MMTDTPMTAFNQGFASSKRRSKTTAAPPVIMAEKRMPAHSLFVTEVACLVVVFDFRIGV